MSASGITQSFRRAKFGSAVALSITSAMSLFPSAASAIELSEVTLQTDCRAAALDRLQSSQKVVVGWDLLCAGKQLQIAKQQEHATDVVGECVDKLKQFRAANPEAFRALGKITRDTACTAAGRIPTPVATGAKPSAG